MTQIIPSVLNLSRGETGEWNLVVTNPANGAAFDLTGCTLRMAIWLGEPGVDVASDDDAEFVLASPSSGIVITEAGDGEITVSISREQSAALTSELYHFSLRVEIGAKAFIASRGVLWMEPQITHAA